MTSEPDILRYWNYGEFIERARGAPAKCASRTDDVGFTGTESLEQAIELAVKGWPHGRRAVLNVSERVSRGLPVREQQALAPTVSGVIPNVGAYIDGLPEDMFTLAEEETLRRVLLIVCSASFSAGVSTSEIQNRGAAVMALVQALEMMGHDCEVIASVDVRRSFGAPGNSWRGVVTVKRAGEYLEPDRLAFALCHPSFLRRLMFGVKEQEPEKIRETFGFKNGRGYGLPCPPIVENSAVHVPELCTGSGAPEFKTLETSLAWIEKELKRQGIEAKAA